MVEDKLSKNKISLDERSIYTEQMNVVVQISHLMRYPYIKKLVKSGELNIMGWYYNIEEGQIYNYDKESKTFLRVE